MTNNQIRAQYDDTTITVYQAYNSAIAKGAVENQTFVPPFKMERMTWIKPSYLWMMYRSGWAQKEGQEHILKIKIKREGFEWALSNACLSHFNSNIHQDRESWKTTLQQSPVRIQWDPEKNIFMEALPYRSIQIGLSDEAVGKYVNEWITEIEDITDNCKNIHQLITEGKIDEAKTLLPVEEIYTVPTAIGEPIAAATM